MTDQSNDNHGQSNAGSHQACVSRRCHTLAAIVFFVVAALMTVAIEAAYAQSNIEKESNDLLKDIMRKRSPSQQENQEPKTTAPKVKARTIPDSNKTVSKSRGRCGRVAGIWTANGWWNGVYGRGDVTLNADGTARHRSGIVGVWTCSANHFKLDWTNWASGQGTLSDDGKTISYTDGNTMTRGF